MAGSAVLCLSVQAQNAAQGPAGGTFTQGQGVILGDGTQHVRVYQGTQKAVIDWSSFNVAEGGKVTFDQPWARQSVTLNRIHDTAPSQILGRIEAPGTVMLLNAHGFLFGPSSVVDVGGLVATTATLDADTFMQSDQWAFSRPPHSPVDAAIHSQGHIRAPGGVVALAAPQVRQQGTIDAALGQVSLAGTHAYTLDLAGDGLIHLALAAPNASLPLVREFGVTVADDAVLGVPGGHVVLSAQQADGVLQSLVNVDGIIEAGRLDAANGQLTLAAADIQLTPRPGTHTHTLTLGGTQVDLAAAVQMVDDGGTLQLAPGSYQLTAPLELTKAIQLHGAPLGGAQVPPTELRADPNQLNAIIRSHPDATLHNLRVVGGVVPPVTGPQPPVGPGTPPVVPPSPPRTTLPLDRDAARAALAHAPSQQSAKAQVVTTDDLGQARLDAVAALIASAAGEASEADDGQVTLDPDSMAALQVYLDSGRTPAPGHGVHTLLEHLDAPVAPRF